jgi:uncharacterized protein (DUF2252 family)
VPEAEGRKELARQARNKVPRSAHGEWAPAPDRADPVAVLTTQDQDRLPWLVPVRHARMAESAFAFYRGAAAIMAADLATTPTIGVPAQLCGDAHLANFGTFASAERRQVFDVNDFDETLPGPWEWDLKRLAASMVIAARDNGLTGKHVRAAAEAATQGYCDAMAAFASTPILDIWYAQAALDDIRQSLPSKSDRKDFDRGVAKARANNSVRVLGKLTESVDGQVRIKRQLPVLVPLADLAKHLDPDEVRSAVTKNFHAYVESLPPSRRHLLHRFTIQDIALKVVGVGSVGTRCWLVLATGRDHGEPLFLQVKEATASVLEAHLPKSKYAHPGERVVEGRRLIQASTDIFLGWSDSVDGRHYYWRQFHDMKGSADVASLSGSRLNNYGELCGWTLAHSHARSGDPITIHGYVGRGHGFSRALADFAVAYADQNEADYEAFRQAIAEGRIEAGEA